MRNFLCLLPLLFIGCHVGAFAEPGVSKTDVVVKLRVTVREKVGALPAPLKNIAGFLVMRGNAAFPDGTCPDSSDDQGEVVCKVRCPADDNSPRLSITPPAREKERKLAAYHLQMSPPIVTIKNCVVVSTMPVEFKYRSDDVLLADLEAESPKIYAAIVTSAGSKGAVKTLAESKVALQILAKNPVNQAELVQFSEAALARGSVLSAAEKKNDRISQYGYGVKSILLLQQASDAKIAYPEQLVAVSPDPSQFTRSVDNLSHTLDKKPVLTGNEANLDATVRKLRVRQLGDRQ